MSATFETLFKNLPLATEVFIALHQLITLWLTQLQ